MTEPASRAPSPPRTTTPCLTLSGRIGPDEADRLSAGVGVCVDVGSAGPLACDVAAVEEPDIGTVDALARMALAARRHGCRVELWRVRSELLELLDLAGLAGLAVEVVGQAEEREEAGRVEEERDPGDPVA